MTPTMTCTECLSLVATADVTELTTAGIVADHCRTCTDCARVVDEVAEEAGRLADLLDGTLPGVPANVVALRAVAGSAPARRRARQRRRALMVGAIVIAPLIALFYSRLVIPAPIVDRQTIALQCLSQEQAAEVARTMAGPRIQVTMHPSSQLPIVTLAGAPDDLARAVQLVTQFDAGWRATRSMFCDTAPGAGASSAPPAAASVPVP